VIGVVARLQPEKGVDVFLQAAGLISSRYPRARYMIVGDGPERSRLAARARSLGLEGVVRFPGAPPDARSLLPDMDLLVVPSRSEGSPLVVLEAMEAGLPVVATRVGGIPEQIGHEREGLLVPPDNAEALAAAVLRLLDDPALAARLGRAGQTRVWREFRYDRMLEQIEGCYRAALEEGGDASWEAASSA
jgi:glycosyltransferase involved in cell wall biosynthesis